MSEAPHGANRPNHGDDFLMKAVTTTEKGNLLQTNRIAPTCYIDINDDLCRSDKSKPLDINRDSPTTPNQPESNHRCNAMFILRRIRKCDAHLRGSHLMPNKRCDEPCQKEENIFRESEFVVITPPPSKVRAESDGGATLSLAQPLLCRNEYESSMTTSYYGGSNISCVTPPSTNRITRNDESELTFDYDGKPFQQSFALPDEVEQQQNRVNFSQTRDYFFGNNKIQDHQIEWRFNHTIQKLYNKRQSSPFGGSALERIALLRRCFYPERDVIKWHGCDDGLSCEVQHCPGNLNRLSNWVWPRQARLTCVKSLPQC